MTSISFDHIESNENPLCGRYKVTDDNDVPLGVLVLRCVDQILHRCGTFQLTYICAVISSLFWVWPSCHLFLVALFLWYKGKSLHIHLHI